MHGHETPPGQFRVTIRELSDTEQAYPTGRNVIWQNHLEAVQASESSRQPRVCSLPFLDCQGLRSRAYLTSSRAL